MCLHWGRLARKVEMTTEQINARLAQLKTELDQLLAEANKQIGMKLGAIAELERIKSEAVNDGTDHG